MSGQTPCVISDVTVLGGGLAGKAASLHLAKAGLKVTCIEPGETARQAVGESLDWPAPDLLSALGLPMDDLIKAKMATWKRHQKPHGVGALRNCVHQPGVEHERGLRATETKRNLLHVPA